MKVHTACYQKENTPIVRWSQTLMGSGWSHAECFFASSILSSSDHTIHLAEHSYFILLPPLPAQPLPQLSQAFLPIFPPHWVPGFQGTELCFWLYYRLAETEPSSGVGEDFISELAKSWPPRLKQVHKHIFLWPAQCTNFFPLVVIF